MFSSNKFLGFFKRFRSDEIEPGDEYVALFIIAIVASIFGAIIFACT